MTSYTLSPFLLTRVQTGVDFYIHVFLHAAYFWGFFSSCFCLFLRQILAEAEKASVKDKGRLLTDCAYEALTLWACMFLILLKCQLTCILSGATGYCFFVREIISMVIHLSLFTCPINHIKVKIYWHDKSSPELTAPNIEPCSQTDRQTNTQTDTLKLGYGCSWNPDNSKPLTWIKIALSSLTLCFCFFVVCWLSF